MKAIKCILVPALLLCCWSCTRVHSTADLQQYVLDPGNGLSKSRTIGPVDVKVTYRPTDLLVRQSLSEAAAPGEIDSLRKGFGQQEYFILSIAANGKEIETYALQQTAFGERVQTLAFGMGEYVRIITDRQDTIPVSDYFYQRTYGVGKTSDFLMAFEAEKLRRSEHFRFQIDEFGLGTGDQNFKFETRHLDQIPKLQPDEIKQ